jgi:D-tyrosyl-tRNA(Tyr) deacylase
MRVVVQRVNRASVLISDRLHCRIQRGLLLLVGIKLNDGQRDVDYIINKTVGLRIFADANKRLNLSITELAEEAAILLVPNFTIYGDTRKGRRPAYCEAAHGEQAKPLFEKLVTGFSKRDISVSSGIFGADMQIELVNDGPVTLIVSSDHL